MQTRTDTMAVFVAFALLVTMATNSGIADVSNGEPESKLARDIIDATFAKDPRDRTPDDLNGAAESAYLLYAAHPSRQSLQEFATTLSVLWKTAGEHGVQAERLAVLMFQYSDPTMAEMNACAVTYRKSNCFFSFVCCKRFLEVGLFSEAVDALSNLGASPEFSTCEEVGLQAMMKIATLHKYAQGSAAPMVWSLYEGTAWVDMSFITGLFENLNFAYLIVSDDDRKTLTLVRINAAASMMTRSPFLRARLIGKNSLIGLRSDVDRFKKTTPEADYRDLVSALDSADKGFDSVKALTQNWNRLRTGGLDRIAESMISKGQVTIIESQNSSIQISPPHD